MKKLFYFFLMATIIGCASNKKIAKNKHVLEFKGFTTESFNLNGKVKAFSEQEYTMEIIDGKYTLNPTFVHCWYYFKNNKLIKRTEIVDDEKFNSTYGKNTIAEKIEMGKDTVFNTNYYLYDINNKFIGINKFNKDSILREVVEIKNSVYDSTKSQYIITKVKQDCIHKSMKEKERVICDQLGRTLEECYLGVVGAPTFKFIRDKNGLLIEKKAELSFGGEMIIRYSYTHFDKNNNWTQVIQSADGRQIIKKRVIVYE